MSTTVVLDFCCRFVLANYLAYFKHNQSEIKNELPKLLEKIRLDIISRREEISHDIETNTIVPLNQLAWFKSEYYHYKKSVRAQDDWEVYKQYIIGKKILDFGSGGGYWGLFLAEKGYRVLQTDVIDYRIAAARHLHFQRMSEVDKIPLANDIVDTTFVKGVLHHIDASKLSNIGAELSRVTRYRLILEEDVIIEAEDPIHRDVIQQNFMSEFLKFNYDEQKLAITYFDIIANFIAAGLSEMNMALNFNTIHYWVSLLENSGFSLEEKRVLGFQNNHVHKTMHAYMVFSK